MSNEGNNRVVVSGTIKKEFKFDHENHGERFYSSILSVKRKSNLYDYLPIMVSDSLIDCKEIWTGNRVCIVGSLRTFNKHQEGKSSKLEIYIFANEIYDDNEEGDQQDINYIQLNGFTCKEVIYRKTPLGREVSDLLIAVNRKYSKSDYIPCIAWGRNARYASMFKVGTAISIEGRLQSREYKKNMGKGIVEDKIAYELSISKLQKN